MRRRQSASQARSVVDPSPWVPVAVTAAHGAETIQPPRPMRMTGQSWPQSRSGRSSPSVRVGEEPHPDGQEDDAEDERRVAAVIGRRRAARRTAESAAAGGRRSTAAGGESAERRGGRRRRWRRAARGRRGVGRMRSGRGSGLGHGVRSYEPSARHRAHRRRAPHRSQAASIRRRAGLDPPATNGSTTEAMRGPRREHGGDRRLRRFRVLLAPRGRARGQGRHAVRRAVGLDLPGRGRRPAGRVPAAARPAPHDPAAQDQLPRQRLGDALARRQGGHLAVRGGLAPARGQARATSSSATSSSTGRRAGPTRSTTARS